ncbi:MAG TPA: hypothetical protein VIN74_11520 [Candidatus Limnocylindria bacterium]
MWSHLIKLVSLSKGALIVGVAASAAMVSNAEFSNAPSHNDLPSPSAVLSAPPATSRPANSPSALASPKASDVPAVQLPAASSPAAPSTTTDSGLVKECVTKYTSLRAAGDNASQGDRESTTSVCTAAIERTGLTSSEFAAKYGLTTTTATPKPTTPTTTNGDLSPEALAMAKECVTKYTLHSADASATCIKAIQLSGLTSSAFAARFLPSRTTEPTATPTPKGTFTAETYALITKCLELYAAASTTGDTKSVSDACAAAIKASGMSSADFWAKFHPAPKATPVPSPTTKPGTAETEGLIYSCRLLQGALVSTSPAEQVNAASAACAKAIGASGLSATAFWAKWAPIKPTTAPSATPAPMSAADLAQLVAKCLDLYKAMATTGDTHAASEACGAAIRATGMTSSDFWAKYHPTTN